MEESYIKRLEKELDDWFNGTSRNYTDIAKYYWANELIYQLDVLEEENAKKLADKDILLKIAEDIIDDDYMWSSVNNILQDYLTDKLREIDSDTKTESVDKGNLIEDNDYDMESMWTAVCGGDNDYIKRAFDKKAIEPNTRYEKFNNENSLIMGALRNGNYDTVDLLKSLGETIRKDEVEEYKSIMAKKTYEDDVTENATEE